MPNLELNNVKNATHKFSRSNINLINKDYHSANDKEKFRTSSTNLDPYLSMNTIKKREKPLSGMSKSSVNVQNDEKNMKI